jgi:hypothetical protein
LKDKRAIERFLAEIEPKYNRSVAKLRSGTIDVESVYAIAGFTAYVLTCSPAAMRIAAYPMAKIAEEVGRRLDAGGKMSKTPPSMGGTSFREPLAKGLVRANVDEKFPQAIGISTIQERLLAFGNFDWEILLNPFASTHPFFTSDFPVASERNDQPGILNRIVPLAPDLAVRIIPRTDRDVHNPERSFKLFRYRRVSLGQQDVSMTNQLIVRCAESLVFFCAEHEWIPSFVEENARYRVEPRVTMFRVGKGTMQIATQVVTDQWES